MADNDNRICAITAAMKYGTGLQHFYQAHKDRFFDVGIAEPHAVTFAGGLASQGFIPVFAVYSSFLQRGYDQLIHDLSIEKQHVILCVDRAGIVGEDGETHQGMFDVAYTSQIPNITIYSPEGYDELKLCIEKAVKDETGVVCVRYPRGNEQKKHSLTPSTEFIYNECQSDTLLISYGRMFSNCYQAIEELDKDISLLKITKLAPLNPKLIEIATTYQNVFFVEEGIKNGGLAQQFGSLLLESGFKGNYQIRAIDNQFVPQSTVDQALVRLGMDKNAIKNFITNNEI